MAQEIERRHTKQRWQHRKLKRRAIRIPTNKPKTKKRGKQEM